MGLYPRDFYFFLIIILNLSFEFSSRVWASGACMHTFPPWSLWYMYETTAQSLCFCLLFFFLMIVCMNTLYVRVLFSLCSSFVPPPMLNLVRCCTLSSESVVFVHFGRPSLLLCGIKWTCQDLFSSHEDVSRGTQVSGFGLNAYNNNNDNKKKNHTIQQTLCRYNSLPCLIFLMLVPPSWINSMFYVFNTVLRSCKAKETYTENRL